MFQEYMLPGGLTPGEYYKVHGKVETAHIECLLDAFENADDLPDGRGYIQEAIGCLPEEDLLSDVLSELVDLAKHVRGDNKSSAESIIKSLNEIQAKLNSAAEEAKDNLNKAEKELDDFYI